MFSTLLDLRSLLSVLLTNSRLFHHPGVFALRMRSPGCWVIPVQRPAQRTAIRRDAPHAAVLRSHSLLAAVA